MTITSDDDEHGLLLAEYALGVLEGEARTRIQQEIENNPSMAAAVAHWQERLQPLAEDIAPVTPAPEVWQRIQNTLGFNERTVVATRVAATRRPEGTRGFWEDVRFWRWLGLGAGTGFAALAACFAFVIFVMSQNAPNGGHGLMAWVDLSRAPSPAVPPAASAQGYQFASLVQSSGTTVWTATLDAAQARMIVVPVVPVVPAAAVAANPSQVPKDRSAELWLVPAQGKPIALGLLSDKHPVVVLLSEKAMAALSANVSLAVSVEPEGGSRTGQPTGPIVAHGAVRSA